MALETYGVTAAVVLKQFPQWTVGGATLPGTTDITAEWIPRYAAKIEEQMLKAGYDSSAVSSDTTESAYYQLRSILARGAAMLYIQAIGVYDSEKMRAAYAAIEKDLNNISAGDRLGEFTATEAAQYVRYNHPGETDDDLDDRRAAMEDYL